MILNFKMNWMKKMKRKNQEYGPIHHLAHLLFHIVEDGKDIEGYNKKRE